jgi:hypothetical protein
MIAAIIYFLFIFNDNARENLLATKAKEVRYQELQARRCSTTVDCVKYIVNMKYAICNM